MAKFEIDNNKMDQVINRFKVEVPLDKGHNILLDLGFLAFRQRQFQEWCIDNFGSKIHSRSFRNERNEMTKKFFVWLPSEADFLAFLLRL